MQEVIDALMAREQQRCEMIVAEDFQGLRSLLSESLVHTHTRGNTDDKESYLRYAREVVQILALKRESLRVIPMSPVAAVMHGKQINRAKLRKQESGEVSVEAMLTQVWALESDKQWRMVACHATPLGAPPPAVAR